MNAIANLKELLTQCAPDEHIDVLRIVTWCSDDVREMKVAPDEALKILRECLEILAQFLSTREKTMKN